MKKCKSSITKEKSWFSMTTSLVLLLYVILILAITFPTIVGLNKTVLGSQYTDTWNALWGICFVKDSILNGTALFFTDNIFYPQGGYFYPINLINAILILPLYLFLPLPVSYNLMIMALMLIAALGMYKLAGYIVKSKSAAFYAGLCYSISPVIISTIHNGTDEFLGVCWVPYYVLSLFRAKEKNNLGVILSGILFLFLATVSSWYIGFSLGIFTIFFLIYNAVIQNDIGNKKAILKRIAFISIIAVALCTPFYWVFFKSVTNEKKVVGIKNEKSVKWALKNINFTDLNGCFKINQFRERSEDRSSEYNSLVLPESQDGYFVHSTYIGWIVLILAIIGLISRHGNPIRIFWAICAVFFFLLSLGPYPRINGLEIKNMLFLKMLPYSIIDHILPLSSYVSLPFRFSILMYLSLFILAGIGLANVLKKIKIRHKPILALFIVTATVLEYLLIAPVPYPFRRCIITVPDFVIDLKNQPGAAIIEIPINHFIYRLLRPGLYYQTYHKKKVIYSLDAFEGISPSLKNNLFINYLDKFSRLDLIKDSGFNAGIEETLAAEIFMTDEYENITTEGTEAYIKIIHEIEDLKKHSFTHLVVYKDLLSKQSGALLIYFLQQHMGKPYWVSDKEVVYTFKDF
ncbi:MAG: hypothetical protein P9M06_07595 [Candidatus Saelkia tenebricola]|nr:hypothetical protein [Candidatus Saelkia tenebricola]